MIVDCGGVDVGDVDGAVGEGGEESEGCSGGEEVELGGDWVSGGVEKRRIGVWGCWLVKVAVGWKILESKI